MERRRVAEGGGSFSTTRVTYSKETQDLLKTMMQESRLTSLQQRKINDQIKKGKELPVKQEIAAQSRSCIKTKVDQCRQQQSRGLRTLKTIQQLEATSDHDYATPTAVTRYNSSVEKEKLHNIMAFGKSELNDDNDQPKHPANSEQEIDRFEEVLKEIEERKEFLKDMSKLGMEQHYHSQLTTEISQKIRELEKMNKQRTLNELS